MFNAQPVKHKHMLKSKFDYVYILKNKIIFKKKFEIQIRKKKYQFCLLKLKAESL